MKVSKYLIWVWIGLSACNTALDKEGYLTWVKDYQNGLHKRKQVGDYIFDVQYKPLLLREIQKSKLTTPFHSQAIKDRKEEMLYYDLRISLEGDKTDILKYGTSDEQAYNQKLYYFSYHFQEDIYIEQGGKRFDCELFHFERSYDLTNTRTFILAFEMPRGTESPITLVIDSQILNLGPVKISFEPKQTPDLTF